MQRDVLEPFQLEQNPGAVECMKPMIESYGQDYILSFFPDIVQKKITSAYEQNLESMFDPCQFQFDDVISDARLACVNGQACWGSYSLPEGKFRMGIFMCDKRWSQRDPDNVLASKPYEQKTFSSSCQSECFERCMCLACAVHSLVRNSFYCINCESCLCKLRENGDRHPTAFIPRFGASPSYMASLAPYPASYKYTKLAINFICCKMKTDAHVAMQVLRTSYVMNMMDYLEKTFFLDLSPGKKRSPSVTPQLELLIDRCFFNENKDLLQLSCILCDKELHEMFVLSSLQLLGICWDANAEKKMKKFTLGQVTHMRPVRASQLPAILHANIQLHNSSEREEMNLHTLDPTTAVSSVLPHHEKKQDVHQSVI